MGKKYCFVGEPVVVKSRFVHSSVTYHRIMAAKNIISPDGKLIAAKGDLGGLVEDESNLEHEGSCWVANEAKVYGCSVVAGNAIVCDNATVCQGSYVSGNAIVKNNATVAASNVSDNAIVAAQARISDSTIKGKATISGDAKISNSNISGYAKIGFMAKIDDSTVKDNAVVYDYAEVSKSEIYGNASVLNYAIITNSKLFNNAVVENNAIAIESKIFNEAKIRDSAVVENSRLICRSVVNKNMHVRNCFINVNESFEEYTKNAVLEKVTMTDSGLGELFCFSLKPFFHITKIGCSITVLWLANAKILLKDMQEEFHTFHSYEKICDFLTENFPIKEEECFSKEENIVVDYIRDIFYSNKVEKVASTYSEKIYEYIKDYFAKVNKSELVGPDKLKLLLNLKACMFFKFVSIYLLIAINSKKQKSFLKDEALSSFIENSRMNITNMKISSFDADMIYDSDICEVISDTFNLSKSIKEDLDSKLQKENIFSLMLNC